MFNNICLIIINSFQIQNPEFDKQFLITLACLKSEDPSTFDEKVKSFNDISKPGISENAKMKEKGKSKKEKPLSLRDYERKIILERNGQFSSSEDEDNTKQKVKSETPTYMEEQKQLRDNFRHVLKDEDEDEDNDLLKIKQKTEDEKHKVFLIYFITFLIVSHVYVCIIVRNTISLFRKKNRTRNG